MNEDANVKLVKDCYAAFQRGDIKAILANIDDSMEFVIPGSPAVPLSGTYRGIAGMQQFFDEHAKTMDFTSFEPHEYIAQGDRVVAIVHYEGRYHSTGRTFSGDSCMIWTIRNGKAVRFLEFTDTEQLARAAQGSDQAMRAR
jgi:ketosteroid isomerase-like protein